MISVPTFTATIYVGFLVTKYPSAEEFNTTFVEILCRDYCDKVGLCVTVTPTKFIYKNGWENGAAIGLINYPRFPKEPKDIKAQALELAEILLKELKQYKVSVVFPDETVMIGEDKH
jgi:ferredoxin